MHQPSPVHHMRGCVVGVVSGVTGISAHAGASGMVPGTDAIVVTSAACAALGAAAASVPRRRASLGMFAILALLVAGQAVAHLTLLALAQHMGADHLMLTPAMFAMHGLATIAAAIAIRVIEPLLGSLLTALVRLVHIVLGPSTSESSAPPSLDALYRDIRPCLRARTPADSRGPPLLAV